MPRGKDTSKDTRRRPMILKIATVPNVLWVNFKNPKEPSPEALSILLGQPQKKGNPADHPAFGIKRFDSDPEGEK